MKAKTISAIIGGIVIFIILVIELIAIIGFNASWWWLGGTLIFLFIVGLIGGVIYLVIRLRKKNPIDQVAPPKDIYQIIKHKIRHDSDLSDELVQIEPAYTHEGMQGIDPTKVVHLKGKLYWQDIDCDVICDVDNPEEATIKRNATEKEIREAILKTAKRPATQEVTEDIPFVDEYGRQTFKKVTTRMTKAEIQKKEEEKKEEEIEGL